MSKSTCLDCPHCGTRPAFHRSIKRSDLETELWYQCRNLLCGHTYIATLEVVRTISNPLTLKNPALEHVPVSFKAKKYSEARVMKEIKTWFLTK